ncbi:hypothetical protein BS50DRAFT_589551 [Corynespora cassiicola Philippines]|uniref:Uncharacterized protein n=1 Tax=Corynespora cassiicola Philippines TaxID=1448308 RepID=A0A2T2NIB8_CORCC|nr:hypothetical protein BS50DRAFT_589551 [Corynespora cassiicola Philippines]
MPSPASIPSPASSSASPASSPADALPPRRRARVSAEHTLNRQKLADMEKRLSEARAEIELLRRERGDHSECESVRFECSLDHGAPPGTEEEGGKEKEERECAQECCTQQRQQQQAQSAPPPHIAPGQTLSSLRAPLIAAAQIPTPDSDPEAESAAAMTGPPPCCTPVPSSSTTPPSPECTTCATRPPPSPTESTTLCSQAYILISQQNFRNLDAATIRRWLWEGYRSAQNRGEGCRVENGVLMSLLDFISGV